MPRRPDGAGGSSQASEGGRGECPMELHGATIPDNLETVRGDPWSDRACHLPVSEPPRGSIKGPSPEIEVGGGNSEEGALGNRYKCSHLRQAREIAADGEQVPNRVGATRGDMPSEIPGIFLRQAHSSSGKIESKGKRDFQDVKFLSLCV